jgi:5-methylcytosine-specific restriction endonuclease McrA
LNDIARGSGKAKVRRAVVKGGGRFTKLDLVQRWGCVCYLCGDEVSFDRSLPLRNRPSIDHVVPIFHGGEHSVENCRVVHFSCNSAKGAKMFELDWVS